MLPNFLIVGAEKAGTTTLASMLSKHSDIFISPHKELHFFTHNWKKGLGWYSSFFDSRTTQKMIGEASPSYTWNTDPFDVPKRIIDTLGDIKYIYIIRNPVERLISHYHHALIKGWINPKLTLKEAIVEIPGLKKCSLYNLQLEQYLKYTNKDQWLIFSLEELSNNTNDIMKQISDFLNIEYENISIEHQNYSKNNMKQNRSIKVLKNILRPILNPIRNTLFLQKLNEKTKEFDKKIDKPNISESVKAELFEFFKEDIKMLNLFCNKNYFDIWDLNYK